MVNLKKCRTGINQVNIEIIGKCIFLLSCNAEKSASTATKKNSPLEQRHKLHHWNQDTAQEHEQICPSFFSIKDKKERNCKILPHIKPAWLKL